MIPLSFTGARAILRVNGQPLAWSIRASYIVETKFDEIRTIDMSTPVELAPGAVIVKATLGMIRVPKATSASLLGIQPNIWAHLTQPYIQIELKDRATDETILVLPRCMMTRRHGNVQAKNIGSETWEFLSIGYWDEMIPTVATEKVNVPLPKPDYLTIRELNRRK